MNHNAEQHKTGIMMWTKDEKEKKRKNHISGHVFRRDSVQFRLMHLLKKPYTETIITWSILFAKILATPVQVKVAFSIICDSLSHI